MIDETIRTTATAITITLAITITITIITNNNKSHQQHVERGDKMRLTK
jgi:hypothetical protein